MSGMSGQGRARTWLLLGRLLLILGCGLIASAAIAQTEGPDPALRAYHSANGLLNRGLDELAAAEYRKFLEAHSNHEKAPVARYGLGVALYRMKQFEQAADQLDRLSALDSFEFAAESQVLLGQCELERKAYGKAAEAFERVLTRHAKHELADDAAALLAEGLYRDGQFDAVARPCELLRTTWPDSPQRERADFFHGLSRMAQKQYAEAAAILADHQKRYPKGEFAGQVSLLLAQSLHHSGAREQAVPHYQHVIKTASGEMLAQALYGLASLLQQARQNEEAAALLDQLIKKFPNHALAGAATLHRGRIWFDDKKYSEATAAFDRATQLDEKLADQSAYWLAKCELRQEQFDAAAQRLHDALQQHPDSELRPEMSYDRAVALMKAGNSADAKTALEQFSAEFAQHELIADATYLRAAIEHEARRFDESQALCATFAKSYGSHELMPAVAFLAAENEFLAGRYETAAKAYRQFIDTHPKDEQAGKAEFRLGMSLYRMDKFDGAQPLLAASLNGRKTPEAYRAGLLALGDIHFRNQKWDDASAALGDYLTFGPDQPGADDAMMKLALSQLRLGAADQALLHCDQLLAMFPSSVHRAQAHFERGQILLERGELDAAADALTQSIQSAGGGGGEGEGESRFAPFATNHLAAIAMRTHDYARAIDLYAQVLQSDAAELAPEAMFQQGQAYMAARQYPQAGEAFAKYLKNHQDQPRVPQAAAQHAIALARQGQSEAALTSIAAVEKQHASKLDPAMLASVRYEKAWCLRELKKTDEAIATYRQLIESKSNEAVLPHALLELAELEAGAKKFEQAAALLTQLRAMGKAGPNAALTPQVAERGLYGLAAAKFELRQFDESAALCEEFIAKHPESELAASARLFCGESLFRSEQHDRAAPHFAHIVAHHTNDPGYSQSLLRLGECQAALQQWRDSEKTFAEYLKSFADSELWFQAQFGVAWARENQGQLDQAIDGYRKVVERHEGPSAARAQFQIGECLFAKKQYAEAVRELLKVDILYAYPEWSAAALYEAGRCFEELSKPAEARAQFELVREKYSESSWAKLAAQRLASQSPTTSGG